MSSYADRIAAHFAITSTPAIADARAMLADAIEAHLPFDEADDTNQSPEAQATWRAVRDAARVAIVAGVGDVGRILGRHGWDADMVVGLED
jgi:hypothetical protein